MIEKEDVEIGKKISQHLSQKCEKHPNYYFLDNIGPILHNNVSKRLLKDRKPVDPALALKLAFLERDVNKFCPPQNYDLL